MKSFKIFDVIKNLTALGERQFKKETEAARYIMSFFREQGVPFKVEDFKTKIPAFGKCSLLIEGKPLGAEPCCFIGGIIESKNNIISSLVSSQRFIRDPNINFNPVCHAISRSNFYFAPAFAIRGKDVAAIAGAKKIKGIIRVRPNIHKSLNILVGNRRNPEAVFFTHYDSLGPGAIDNASGVAVLAKIIIERPETLKKFLHVFAGNEELSYDYPVYWGHGYRVFEKKWLRVLEKTDRVYAVDCVGNGPTTIKRNSKVAKLAFPIKNLDKLKKKIYSVYGNIEELMKVYHSNLDIPKRVSLMYLNEAAEKLLFHSQKVQ